MQGSDSLRKSTPVAPRPIRLRGEPISAFIVELRWPASLGQGRGPGETSGTGETGGKGETLGIRGCASRLSRKACPSRT